jgi:hypothetical protein
VLRISRASTNSVDPDQDIDESRTEVEERSARGLGHHHLIVPGAILILTVPWLIKIQDRFHAALVLAQIMLCAFGIVSSYARGWRPMRMVFFIFMLSWLGIGPLYQLAHHRIAWGDSGLLDQTGLVTQALLLTLGMTVALSVAMWHADGTGRGPDAKPSRDIEPRPWAPWSFLLLLLALTPYVVATNGGVMAFFSSRDDRVGGVASSGVSLAQSGGALVALAFIVPAALAVATTHLFLLRIRLGRKDRTKPGVLGISLLDGLGIVGAFAMLVLYANPLSNTRFISIAAFGSVALAMVRPRSPNAGKWIAVGLAIATLGVYPLSNALAANTASTLATGPVDHSPLAVFAGKDFDGFQQIINSIIYVHDHGFSFGSYSLSALFYFVPRSLWTTKATPASIDVAENRNYWFANLSLPIHSEFYIEFGVVGMLLIAAVAGHVWARIDRAWLERPGSMAAWLAPFLSLAQLGMIRGPLGSLAPVWLTVTGLLVLGVRRVRSEQRYGRDAAATAEKSAGDPWPPLTTAGPAHSRNGDAELHRKGHAAIGSGLPDPFLG